MEIIRTENGEERGEYLVTAKFGSIRETRDAALLGKLEDAAEAFAGSRLSWSPTPVATQFLDARGKPIPEDRMYGEKLIPTAAIQATYRFHRAL